MNGRGDYPDAMGELLDDAGIEALLRGDPPVAEPELAAVAAFVRDLRTSAARPAPAPSAALAALFQQGPAEASLRPPVAAASRRRPALPWWRRLAVTGIGFGVAVTGVVGAGAAGLLPQVAEDAVGEVVEVLTPLELPTRRSADGTDGDRPGGSGTTTAVPGTRDGGDGARAPGSLPQPGSAPRDTSGPTAPGATGRTSTDGTTTTSTTRPPAGGTTTITTPGTTAPSVPAPTTPTTLPRAEPLPRPTLPNVSTTLPGAPISLPPTPW